MHASTEPQVTTKIHKFSDGIASLSVTVDDHEEANDNVARAEELARSIIEVRAIALANWRSNTMHASTEPQTTEPKTLDIASLFEKGVFVTVDDHEDLPFDAAIREAGQALIRAVSSVFELRGTHFNIVVRPVETAQERRVCLLRDGAVAVTVTKN